MSMGTWDPADEAERNEQLLDINQAPDGVMEKPAECKGCGRDVPEGVSFCTYCVKEFEIW